MNTPRLAVVALLALTACGRTTTYRPKPIPPPPHVPLCALVLENATLDFGALGAGESKVLTVTIRNDGDAACDVSISQILGGTPVSFSLAEPDPGQVTIEGGGDEFLFTVRFDAGVASLPQKRTGSITLTTTDKKHPTLTVQLAGSVKLCDLHATPSPLDFGNVTLNAKALAHLTLSNAGAARCDLSRIVFGPSTDPLFSFSPIPGPQSLAAGASTQVTLVFSATSSTMPFLRTGSVLVDSNDPAHAELVVPLSAFINTICTQAGQYIYTVDSQGMFSRFDPTTLTSVDIADLNCPTMGGNPFSMNVDQKGIAWVIFDDNALYRVDTANGACTATPYVPGQHGFDTYGMGSVFDSASGMDTLYLSSGSFNGTSSQLGTLSFPGLTVTPVATVPIGWLELAGTGDGQLWAYSPGNSTLATLPTLARLDRNSGVLLEKYSVPEITTVGGFAVKFFGGAFFIFVGTDVWKIDRSALLPGHTTPTVPAKRVLTNPGRNVVGAGVSTCAPVQN